jgi:hypothetical protein
LNAGKPVKEPQADGTGDVENHLPDFDLEIILLNRFRHDVFSSLQMIGNYSDYCVRSKFYAD